MKPGEIIKTINGYVKLISISDVQDKKRYCILTPSGKACLWEEEFQNIIVKKVE